MSKSMFQRAGSGLLAVLAGMLLVSTANAVGTPSQVSCSDIEFNKEIVLYPDINKACLSIIDYEGEQYANIQGKVVRAGKNRLVIKYMHADGNYGEAFQTNELPSEFRVYLNGKKTRISDLKRDQILNLYIRIGATMATMIVPESTAMGVEVDPEPEPVQVTMVAVPEMLPKTAGWFYETLLAGLLLLAIGGSLTLSRVRRA